MESKNYKKSIVRNNGKKCGEIISYKNNIKKGLIIGGFIFIGGSGFILGRASAKSEVTPVIYNTLTEKYFDEPTYNGIPYTVSAGDTLMDIVYSYETDANKVQKNIRLIEDYNKIDSNRIKSGQTIYLVGVPASKLEEFGYTDNYNYFAPEVEVELRLEFLDKVVLYLIDSENYDDNFISDYRKVANDYADYRNEHIEGDEYKLDYIINVLRDLSENAKDFGFSFENNLKAMPLSEAENYSFGKTNV